MGRGDEAEDEYDLLVRLVAVGVAVLAAASAVEVMPWMVDDIVTIGGGGSGSIDAQATVRLMGLSFGGMAFAGALAGAFLSMVSVLRWPVWRRVVLVAALGLMIGGSRTAAVAFGLRGALPREYGVLETLLGGLQAALVITAAIYYVGTRRRIRAEERLRLREALRAERARRDLEQEELRVRREVSHRLHGGLQQRMVLVNREIEEIRDELLRHGETEQARSLTELSDTLDEIRELEVRAVAHDLYPMAAEIDLPSALLLVIDRLPESVRMRVDYDREAESLYRGAGLSPQDRVLLYSIIEEAATNAVRHGHARNIAVTLGTTHDPCADGRETRADDARTTAHVRIDDDGTGIDDSAPPSLSGLAVLQARVRARGGELTIAPGTQGTGVRLTARLPLEVLADERDRA